MSDEEIWKPIPDFDGYEVSSLGNVRSYRRKHGGEFHKVPHAIKPAVAGKSPYRFVNLMGKDGLQHILRVGTLVLIAFVGQRPFGLLRCHKDDNPINDVLKNLYWGTPKQNGQDMSRNHRLDGTRIITFKMNINKSQRRLLRSYIVNKELERLMAESKTTGYIIKKFRLQQDRSLRDFAADLNVSHTAIDQWERNESDINSDRLDEWVSSKTNWITQMGVEIYWLKKQESIAKFMQVVSNNDTEKKAA